MSNLTRTQLEDFFWNLTMQMLGLDPTLPQNQNKVRISWPTHGSPAWEITDDVCFLKVNSQDDQISKQFDTNYTTQTGYNLNENISYIGVRRVDFVLYGPNSFENAEIIKNALYTSSTYRVLLQQNNLSVVQDVNIPIRLPELYNGQWWERTNFYVSFNELVTTSNVIQAIQTVNITAEADSLKQANNIEITTN